MFYFTYFASRFETDPIINNCCGSAIERPGDNQRVFARVVSIFSRPSTTSANSR